METQMVWRAGNKNTAEMAVDVDLSSWEIINPSNEDDVISLSFSESLSEKDPSSDDERPGSNEEDPQEDDQRSGFDQHVVPELVTGQSDDLSPRDSSSDNQLWGFDDDDERSGFDDPGVDLEENMLPQLPPSSSSVDQRWRFDWDSDKWPGLDEEVPEEDYQEGDERPGFDEHSVGLWEYTVKLIGLGQFDDHVPSDPSSFDQRLGLNDDRRDELGEILSPKLVFPCNDQRSGLNGDHGDESGSGLNDDRGDELGENLTREHVHPYDDQRCGLDDECDERVVSEDENDDVAYDVDDDLVPFYVKNRFGKQRLGKVGKKVNTGKMKKRPKRMPRYYYNKVT